MYKARFFKTIHDEINVHNRAETCRLSSSPKFGTPNLAELLRDSIFSQPKG